MPINFQSLSSILSAGVIVSIAIFIVSQVVLFLSKKKESKERISRVCKSLKIDIDNLSTWYESNQYQAFKSRHFITEYNKKTEKYEQKNEYFQNIINTVPYNGIVNSGLITYLDEKTQDKLNKYYTYAALHNKRMFDLAQIYNDKASSAEFKMEDIEPLWRTLAWAINESERFVASNGSEICPSNNCKYGVEEGQFNPNYSGGYSFGGKLKVTIQEEDVKKSKFYDFSVSFDKTGEEERGDQLLQFLEGTFGLGGDTFSPDIEYDITNATLEVDEKSPVLTIEGERAPF